MNESSPSPTIDLHTASEEDLACRVQRGCAESFDLLVERLQPRLLFVLRRRMRNFADAEDVAQKTLLRVYEKIQLYNPQQKFSPWLFTIAVRLATDHHRKAQLPTVAGESTAALVDPARDPAQQAMGREAAEDIWALAERVLKPDQWTALWLQYGEDQSVKEIAHTLDRTSVSVRVLLFRARQKLMPHLSQYTESFEPASEMAEASHPLATPTPQLVRMET